MWFIAPTIIVHSIKCRLGKRLAPGNLTVIFDGSTDGQQEEICRCQLKPEDILGKLLLNETDH